MYLQLRIFGALWYDSEVDGLECMRALGFMCEMESGGFAPSAMMVDQIFGTK